MTIKKSDIAIIGMSCLLPGADTIAGFWASIKESRDAIKDIPSTHWSIDDYYDPNPKAADKTYGRRGGFLSQINFEPLKYGIAPKDLSAIDTTQLLALVAADRALADAGYGANQDYDHGRTSVMLGVTGALKMVVTLGSRLAHPQLRRALENSGVDSETVEDVLGHFASEFVPWQENSFPGLLGNVTAGRIANRLNLGGANFVVDAACASSLAAMRQGIVELQSGHADMVVSGGVDTFSDHFMYTCFSKTPALSPSGEVRPYDQSGDGTILGEGIGIVILKRLADAERDGDRIFAVIKALGASSDGKGTAIFAPAAEGQSRAIQNALQSAGISADTIELVEGHGTGTAVGDAVEVNALTQVFSESRIKGTVGPWCALGSVKAQIGHTKAAAGVSGLIKASLALYFKVLPPAVKITQPLTEILDPQSPFYLCTYPRPWLASTKHPRRAGISAFGFGGSNFHCILEEYSPSKALPENTQCIEIYAFSGSSHRQIANALQQALDLPIEERAEMAVHSRVLFKSSDFARLILVSNVENFSTLAAETLNLLQNGPIIDENEMPKGAFYGEGDYGFKPYGFLIPEADAAYPQMFRELACDWPQLLEALSEINVQEDGTPLSLLLYPPDMCSTEALKRWHNGFQNIKTQASEAVFSGLKKILASFGLKTDNHIDLLHDSKPDSLRQQIEEKSDVKLWLELGPGSHLSQLAQEAKSTVHCLALDQKNAGNKDLALFIGQLAAWGLDVKLSSWPKDQNNAAHEVETAFTVPVCGANLFVKTERPPKTTKTAPALSNITNGQDSNHAAIQAIEKMASEAARLHQQFLNTHNEALRLMASILPEKSSCVPMLKDTWQHESMHQVDKTPSSPILSEKTTHEAKTKQKDYSFQILQIVARETGYPVEMLQPEMSLEADLGLDSIKKVEILAAVSEELPEAKELGADAMSSVSTLGELMRLTGSVASVGTPSPAMSQTITSRCEEAKADNWDMIKNVISHETGYPMEMLTPEMSLTDDLGLDSIKLVEIVSSINEKLPQVENLSGDIISEAKTLGDLAQAFSGSVLHTAAKSDRYIEVSSLPDDTINTAAASTIEEQIINILAVETGYPADMLNMDMNLELDLGLDSIKKVEFMAALSEKMPEAQALSTSSVMSEIQTLGDLARLLGSPSSKTNKIEKSNSLKSIDQIDDILLEVVSLETGYPKDILSFTADLESDLGLDSIKKVEIMSALNDRIAENSSFTTVSAEVLNSAKTLGDLRDLLKGVSGAETEKISTESKQAHQYNINKEQAPAPKRRPGRPPKNSPIEVVKEKEGKEDFVILPETSGQSLSCWQVECSSPLSGYGGALPQLPVAGGKMWLLADNSLLSSALSELFTNRGVTVISINWKDCDSISSLNLPDPESLIMIWPQGSNDLSLAAKAFKVLQMAGKKLSQAPVNDRKHLLMAMTFMGGSFGFNLKDTTIEAASGSLCGMMKTCAREWKDTVVRTLDLPPNAYKDNASKYLSAILESTAAGFPVEVGISEELDFCTPTLKPYKLKNIRVRHVREGQNILVTGGARGVTAAALKELARSNKPHLIILSRTPLPPQEPSWLKDLNEKEIKEALFKKIEPKLSPKDLSNQCEIILRGRELKENIAELEKAGAKVTYISGNMSEKKYLVKIMTDVKSKYGSIHGFIHGAGVLADGLIVDKKLPDFEKVFDTKARMASTILELLKDDPLSLLVFFSSSTARFGRKGQSDYAAGNEVLNKIALSVQASKKGIKCLSVDWGPWNGGMVNTSLASLFEHEGIGLIPLHEGAKLFASLVGSPKSDPVELVVLGPDTEIGEMPIKM